ncbi:MAG TPA: 3-hydroxyacyl-CoA dehydrogenase NAD-binding domain-containing protein, partial [Vicinamibacteria bacterium]|nr:3-hydroxyacyl-CoA dehydrogenase NAD-binding domain-containing protein [Vicinamibacteria bacterium]
MSERALRHELGADGVLVVTFDLPGARVNTLGRSVIAEFEALLAGFEKDEAPAQALVLSSGKPDNFIAGADINEFTGIQSALEGETLARLGQALLDRVAALPVPTVAAIHGSCMGGGTELALACSYRIASDDPRTSIGLPEVMLGLIPGLGGTQRLPRLVGYRGALDMILTGRALRAGRARKLGLLDDVVPAPVLLEAARGAAAGLAAGGLRPSRRGFSLLERVLKPAILWRARAEVMKRSGGHYPAPLKALEAVGQGSATSLEAGLKLEARLFGELSVSPVSRALVSVFFATQEIKKDTGVPDGTEVRDVRKLGVLGAGLMGAGIAGAAAEQGVAVRLKDTTSDALSRGLRYVRDLLEERRRRGSLGPREVQQRMDRLAPATEMSGFRRADLVIEAVFEDLELKRRVLAEAESVTGDGCVYATNTSSLPIGEIAREARRPSRILGMHFFSPVHRMPLLEVVVTKETDAWATATAVAFGRRLGKHVIVVRDGPGFYTTRALSPYMNEAARAVEEGARIEDVDAAMTAFGFPVGPVALLDEVGIDVGAKVAKILHHAFGERLAPPASMGRVVEDGRLGRKNGRGFYRYADGKKRGADESVYALLPAVERRPGDLRAVQDRLVFAFLNEAALCLQ